MTHRSARTGLDDPFDGEDAQAALRAAADAVEPPADTMVPLNVLTGLCGDIEKMIASEEAEHSDSENDERARDLAGVSAFVLGDVLELTNRAIGRVLGSS